MRLWRVESRLDWMKFSVFSRTFLELKMALHSVHGTNGMVGMCVAIGRS